MRGGNGWALRHRGVYEGIIWHGQGSDISGKGNDCHPLFANRRLQRNLECAWHLSRVRNQLAVVAAFLKHSFWMGLLKVHRADLVAWDLSRERQHRCVASMSVVQSIDQMHVSWSATSRACREVTA